VPLTYDQEEVMAIELGYKATLLDGKLQLNSSVYTYTYDDYQDRIQIFNEAAGTSQDQVRNANEAENRGVEVEFIWLPTDELTLGGNLSYTKTEYTDDIFVLENDNPFFPIQIFNQTSAGGRDDFLANNLDGNDLKRIPEWKYTLWGSYEWRLNRGTLTAGATWSYTGEYQSDGIARAYDEVPERDRLDLSLTWRDDLDKYVVRAFVDNALDEVHTRGIGSSTAGADWRRTASVLYPRFYGLDVTFRFGAL